MHYTRVNTVIALAAAIWFATSVPSGAVTISNLDDVEHRIVFEDTPGSKMIHLLGPGQTMQSLRHGGEIYVEDKPVRIRYRASDLLVIWGDGNIQIQKRRNSRGDAF